MLDKTYHPADVEERLYAQWEKAGVFAADPSSGAVPYTIMMPPPNVTGSLHMGHALTFTLQDLLIRYHRMTGRDALWQPGTDHAGIATQMVVERNLEKEGITRHDLGRETFIDKVWEWKEHSGGTITRQLRRLGASPDWARERFTMDDGLSAAVRTIFVKLHKDGLIYRDKRLVNWDPKLHTAISDLEVEQREVTGKMWYFRYPVEGEPNTFITVGTTRPETMLGDTGVAVHPDDERYRHLIGKMVRLPIVGRLIPIVPDEYADPEKGSGAVKITPAHDFNDFEVGKRHGLRLINVLDLNAKIIDQPYGVLRFQDGRAEVSYDEAGNPIMGELPERVRGLDRFKARELIVAEIEELGLLEKIDENPMTVPYGDRSGVVIEPWLTDQWFVDAATLARKPIEAVETGKTVFVPKQWEKTFFEWMRNIQPWCISRQIWWGHQIPAWFGPDGHAFVEMTEEEAVAAAEKHYGAPTTLVRDPDVLDTWFSSALWPFSTIGWPEKTPELARYYPTDVLVTGFDIIFFWVARMMMFGMYAMDDVPFKTVYIHALVRDEKGQKMSKSKGNVIDPLDLIGQYGTDALRFTLAAMAAQGRDIKMSEQRVAGYRNFATKLWNAARFCEMNECRLDPAFDPRAVKSTLNQWIIAKTAEAAASVGQGIDGYKFNEAAQGVYQFTWGTFCDWYLEFAKPVFNGSDEAAKAETRATAAWVLDQILILLHPFMPFITEELWGRVADGRAGMLISVKWPDYAGLDAPDARTEMDWVVDLISSVRSVRAEMNVPPGAKMPMTLKDAGGLTRQRLDTHRPLIETLARLESIVVAEGDVPVKAAAQVVVGEATAILPLEGFIDVAAEKVRLEKEIKKQDGEIKKLSGKLTNGAFLAKAPADVVEEQRERLAEAEAAKARLSAALGRLG
ncbi:valine--tRNA ligase [Novispirillum sp. DQ9]|uniref:valine--tRNA ligase n=1 Tax=Novispirillum sp. DQ9 TaxID=3398612 RepID=UPI003C7AD9BE